MFRFCIRGVANYDGFWGLLLDRNGERFMNEYCNFQYGGRQVFIQEESKAYAIWDKGHIKVADKWYAGQGSLSMVPMTEEEVYANWDAMVDNGAYLKADTLEELVDAMGLPKERALASVERYNELCSKGEDEDFYKRASALVSIAEGPFYGAVSGDMSFLTVLGGLRTNANMQVCDEGDNAIPGLYNVGTMIGDFYAGLYTFQMEGVNYGAACDCFGYLTGRFIAENE